MYPMKDRSGNSHDFTDDVVSAIDGIVALLAKAKEEAMKDCPYETEFLLFQATIELRKAMQTVETVSDFYDRVVV